MGLRHTKPVNRLRVLTRLLGWRDTLRFYQHHIDKKAAGFPHGFPRVITWYEVGVSTGGRVDCFLQINESPQGQATTYTGAVYAIRYRIFSGWHNFSLFSNDDDLEREAARIAGWLAFDCFATIDKRRAFRQAHPECVGLSWRSIRTSARDTIKERPKEEQGAKPPADDTGPSGRS